MTAAAPSGVVTFLFTDIEGSTRRWETDADGMRIALAAHDTVLRTAIEAHGAHMFKHTNDRLPLSTLCRGSRRQQRPRTERTTIPQIVRSCR